MDKNWLGNFELSDFMCKFVYIQDSSLVKRFFVVAVIFASSSGLKRRVEKIQGRKNSGLKFHATFFPASLIALRPLSLEPRSRKIVPHNVKQRPNGPAYFNSFFATMTHLSSEGQIWNIKRSNFDKVEKFKKITWIWSHHLLL